MKLILTTTTLTYLLQLAAICHLGLAWAGASMPKAVGLRQHLAELPTFLRRLFLVYFTFIGMILLGFGCLTFLYARDMATGVPVARGLCLLMTAFWLARLLVAAFVFDVRPYLTSWFYRLGYQATNLVFVYLLMIYALTAWKGGSL